MFTLLLALAAPAHAQIDPYTIARLVEADRVVGWAYADPPGERCTATEYFFLADGYAYPSGATDTRLAVAGDHEATDGLAGFLKEVSEQKGTLVRVEITETSRDCPGR